MERQRRSGAKKATAPADASRHNAVMTCREEILGVLQQLSTRRPDGTFSVNEVLDAMQARGSTYKASTIKSHVISKMCRDAPRYHATQYPDLERVAVNTYRLLTPEGGP